MNLNGDKKRNHSKKIPKEKVICKQSGFNTLIAFSVGALLGNFINTNNNNKNKNGKRR